jgi:hypothetical protein
MKADCLAGIGETGADLRMQASDRSRDRDRFGTRDELLDECSPAGATHPPGAEDAVQELTDGDDADRPFLVSNEILEWPSRPLVLDEQVRVDQDCQGSSG